MSHVSAHIAVNTEHKTIEKAINAVLRVDPEISTDIKREQYLGFFLMFNKMKIIPKISK